jgi:putative ABC transport system permease protein
MDQRRIVQMSFDSLGTHRLRTFLTMLGVIIGVAAVVAMLSIGQGAEKEVLEGIALLGVNNVIVTAQPAESAPGNAESPRFSPGLSRADADNIDDFTELIAHVVPQRYESVESVRHRRQVAAVRVVATTPEFRLATSADVGSGRFLVPSDSRTYAQVCVLGAQAKQALFAYGDPVGDVVRIGDLDFTVVGVMVDKAIQRGKIEGVELKNLNDDIYIPLATAQKKFDRGQVAVRDRAGSPPSQQPKSSPPEVDQILVTAVQPELVPATAQLVARVLERRHSGVSDYDILVPEALLRQSQKTQRIFTLVMGAIAGLSLLVGGIGIMNIMLATVLERTSEIGVRRAVGATRRDIRVQFLAEAVVICLLGCAIGLMLGQGISRLISFYAHWPTVVSLFSILLATGVSSLVGIVFGLYPAARAARVNVIESLRHE